MSRADNLWKPLSFVSLDSYDSLIYFEELALLDCLGSLSPWLASASGGFGQFVLDFLG